MLFRSIFHRLYSLEDKNDHTAKFVFNPLFEASCLTVTQVVNALNKNVSLQCVSVISSQSRMPIGYLLPDWFSIDDSRFLVLLSMVDCEVDAELIGRLYCCEVRFIPVNIRCQERLQQNGFVLKENKRIYRWIAERAIAVLEPLTGLAPVAVLGRRNSIPFTAIMPHHAGDALFFAIAWRETDSLIHRLAVNKAYCDVITDVAPELELLPIDIPPANRSEKFNQGDVTTEQDYFNCLKDGLPRDAFYYYCRPSRDYNATHFHLVDHFAFALGQHFCTTDSLLTRRRIMPALFRPNIPPEPIRIFLHFDAGWSLKVYPKNAQERLIDQLYERGYEITVLAGRAYTHSKCRVVTFQGHAALADLLKAHHIVVGMDSFPSHYASQILGLPTICLFSSTRPENAAARLARNYLHLEKGLFCRPCYGVAACPKNGKDYCENFVSPEIVSAEIYHMLDAVKNYSSSRLAARSFQSTDDCIPVVPDGGGRMKRISMKYLRARVFFFGTLLPYFRYGSLVFQEFSAAIEREGLYLTFFRTLRFLRKTTRRLFNS